MFCKSCGQQLRDGAAFCSNCGTKVQSQTEAVNKSTEIPTNAYAFTMATQRDDTASGKVLENSFWHNMRTEMAYFLPFLAGLEEILTLAWLLFAVFATAMPSDGRTKEMSIGFFVFIAFIGIIFVGVEFFLCNRCLAAWYERDKSKATKYLMYALIVDLVLAIPLLFIGFGLLFFIPLLVFLIIVVRKRKEYIALDDIPRKDYWADTVMGKIRIPVGLTGIITFIIALFLPAYKSVAGVGQYGVGADSVSVFHFINVILILFCFLFIADLFYLFRTKIDYIISSAITFILTCIVIYSMHREINYRSAEFLGNKAEIGTKAGMGYIMLIVSAICFLLSIFFSFERSREVAEYLERKGKK